MYVFGGFCRTFDPKKPLDPVRPIPDKVHLRKALDWLDSPVAIAAMVKSRQIMLSWLATAYLTWIIRFGAHRHGFIYCKNEDDASEFVFNGDWFTSRAAFLEYAMPEVLWHPRITAKVGMLVYPEGSFVRALTKNKNAFRGGVGTFALIDEAGFAADLEEVYTGALASVKGGGRLRLFSSACYGSYFGEIIEATEKQAA